MPTVTAARIVALFNQAQLEGRERFMPMVGPLPGWPSDISLRRHVLKSEAPPGTRERTTERRSRTTKGIVVLIDRDSCSCDQVARALEVHGYHVLTAENNSEGAELVRVCRPDGIVASAGPENDERALHDIVTLLLPAHAVLILRRSESTPEVSRDVTAAGHSRVLRVHQSLGGDQLGWLLDRMVRKRWTSRAAF